MRLRSRESSRPAAQFGYIVANPVPRIPPESPTPDPKRKALVEAAELLAKILDTTVKIPGTPFYVGLDPLLGLIPGLGDILPILSVPL